MIVVVSFMALSKDTYWGLAGYGSAAVARKTERRLLHSFLPRADIFEGIT
jgi:hypothetical protein